MLYIAYSYELQICSNARSLGLGKRLMDILEELCEKWSVSLYSRDRLSFSSMMIFVFSIEKKARVRESDAHVLQAQYARPAILSRQTQVSVNLSWFESHFVFKTKQQQQKLHSWRDWHWRGRPRRRLRHIEQGHVVGLLGRRRRRRRRVIWVTRTSCLSLFVCFY